MTFRYEILNPWAPFANEKVTVEAETSGELLSKALEAQNVLQELATAAKLGRLASGEHGSPAPRNGNGKADFSGYRDAPQQGSTAPRNGNGQSNYRGNSNGNSRGGGNGSRNDRPPMSRSDANSYACKWEGIPYDKDLWRQLGACGLRYFGKKEGGDGHWYGDAPLDGDLEHLNQYLTRDGTDDLPPSFRQ